MWYKLLFFAYLPPANEVWGKVIFLQLFVILFTWVGVCGFPGGVCVVAGGHVWLPGVMCGCRGSCVVAGGHMWLLEGMHGCQGAELAAELAWFQGGMCGCRGGLCGCGGMHGCRGVHGCEGTCVVVRGVHGCGGHACVTWSVSDPAQ